MKLIRHTVLIMILCAAFSARATDLRGRVDGTHGYAPGATFPVPGAQIILFESNPAGGNTPVARTVSGVDGIYYFKGISAGNFVLQVNGTNYPLQVLPQAAQDIQPVLLRF